MTIYFINFINDTDRMFHDLDATRDEIPRPYIYTREAIEQAGYRFQLTLDCKDLSDVAAIVSLADVSLVYMQHIHRYPREKCALFLFEPPTVLPHLYDPCLTRFFGKIFTMFDDMVDNKAYFKFYHPNPRETRVSAIPSFDEKRFGVMVQSRLASRHPQELYSERVRFAAYLAHAPDFDLYGRGWDSFPCAKGPLTGNKQETLKRYKFCFCLENMKNQRGYITDRIFEAMYGGAVPVYWGATNIGDYVPSDCFIDWTAFKTYDEMMDFLRSMDRASYEGYLHRIGLYLATSQDGPYGSRSFAKQVRQAINF